jgi:beta-galactosidase
MADSGTMLSAGDLSLPVIPAGCVLNFPWLSYFPKLSELALAALRCYHSSRIAPLRELYLELRTIIQRPTSWCDGGHEVACTQLTLPMPFGGFLPGPKIMKSLPTKFPTLRVHESSEGLLQVQSAAGMDLTFYLTGKLNGTVRSAFDRGLPILVGGPVPCFWRAPTDNDRGGEDISYCSRWRRAGMDRLRMVSYLFLQVLDSELVSSLDDITFIYISFVIDNTHRLALARQNELMDQVRLAQSGCQLHIVLIQEEITAMTLLEFLLSLLMLCTRQAQYLSS